MRNGLNETPRTGTVGSVGAHLHDRPADEKKANEREGVRHLRHVIFAFNDRWAGLAWPSCGPPVGSVELNWGAALAR